MGCLSDILSRVRKSGREGRHRFDRRRPDLPEGLGGVVADLIGAVLLKQNDQWQLQHRDMQTEAMAELTSSVLDTERGRLPLQAA